VTSVHRDNRYLVAVVFGGSSAGSRDERMRELIHDHIAEAAVQRAAPLVAEAESRSETKPGTKSAPQTYSVASAGSVPVTLAAVKPEAKPDPKARTKAEAKSEAKPGAKAESKSAPQAYAVASATSVPVTLTSKSDPGASTTVQVPRWAATNSAPAPHVAPAIGSEDPIHPVLVRTVMVKPEARLSPPRSRHSSCPRRESRRHPLAPPQPAAGPDTSNRARTGEDRGCCRFPPTGDAPRRDRRPAVTHHNRLGR